MLETAATSSIKCNNCGSIMTRAAASFTHELMYPVTKPSQTGHRHPKGPKTTFSQVLKKSVERDMSIQGWCQTCKTYRKTLNTKKRIDNIPSVLTLLAGSLNDESRRLWATPDWLPPEIGVIVKGGEFFCYEGEDLKFQLQRGYHNITVYSLMGVAINIDVDQGPAESHLVAVVNGTSGPHLLCRRGSSYKSQSRARSPRPNHVISGTFSTTSMSNLSPRKRH
jgi:PAB-dependent poly(A)-specific ribonuclease subunit 2